MRFGTRYLLIVVLVMFFGIPANTSGVILITHGFNADAKGWVNAMAAAIEPYPGLTLTNTSTYEIYFEQDTGGSYVPNQRKLRGANPLQSNSGEIILLLDWSLIAGTPLGGVPYSTYDIAPAVASTLTAQGFITDLGSRPLVEQSLHLIGHSRGGSLVCEIARILGRQGIWIDQITTLDPHPLNNDYDDSFFTVVVDAPAHPYANVIFADNYYQVNNSFLGLDPSGQYVTGAYNRYLTGLNLGGYGGIAALHSNVHLWYHGTVDWRTPADDGAAIITGLERESWWTAPETNGLTAGFHLSLQGGADRASSDAPAGGTNRISNGLNQLWDFGAGVRANRFALDENLGLWPNLLTFNIDATNLTLLPNGKKWHTIESGSSLTVRFMYQTGTMPGTGLVVRTFLDIDFNPYSGNETSVQSASIAPTGVDLVSTVSKSISTAVEPGVYAVGAEISDGTRRRFLYAPELLQIEPAPLNLSIKADENLVEIDIAAAFSPVVVETSDDLFNWSPVLTNAEPGAVWSFAFPGEGEAAKFFRAKRL